MVGHVAVLQHLIDEHHPSDDFPNRRLPVAIDDSLMLEPGSVQAQEVLILRDGGPALAGGQCEMEPSSTLSIPTSWQVSTSTPRRRNPIVTAFGICSSV